MILWYSPWSLAYWEKGNNILFYLFSLTIYTNTYFKVRPNNNIMWCKTTKPDSLVKILLLQIHQLGGGRCLILSGVSLKTQAQLEPDSLNQAAWIIFYNRVQMFKFGRREREAQAQRERKHGVWPQMGSHAPTWLRLIFTDDVTAHRMQRNYQYSWCTIIFKHCSLLINHSHL